MNRLVPLSAVLGLCLGLPAAQAASLDCTAFLTGQWAGKGSIDVFGSKTELDNAYTYGADGTFKTLNRFKGQSGEWEEQQVSGKWSAAPGDGPNDCTVTMSSEGEGFSSSSTSTFVKVDDATFSSLGFNMIRVITP